MLLFLRIIFIVLTFISFEHVAIAQDVPDLPSIDLPLYKHTDASKPVYSCQIKTVDANGNPSKVNLLIDSDAPFMWYDCVLQWNIYPGSCPNNTLCTSPFSCEDGECTDVRTSYSYHNPSCPPATNSSTLPGWEYCSCPVNVFNPITASCGQAELNYNRFRVVNPISACAPSSSFLSFPANVTGVMPLSSSPYALKGFLYDPLLKVIALCFPSTVNTPGILSYGNSLDYLLPQWTRFLSYTPLVVHPGSFGHFIGVNEIVIKKRSITIPANTSTKISTTEHYTILRTDIYGAVVRRFSKVTKRIPLAKPVPPFGLCFNTSTNGTHVGFRVPDIDFIISEGKRWSVSTANSIKQITKDISCLAFVDGGATAEPAIVIGTFQMEDNFVVFDLENDLFLFTSSLLRKHTSCANFNSTVFN